MLYLGIFGLEFENTVRFETSTLGYVKNEFLTHTVVFGMKSAFSKGPGQGRVHSVKYARRITKQPSSYV